MRKGLTKNNEHHMAGQSNLGYCGVLSLHPWWHSIRKSGWIRRCYQILHDEFLEERRLENTKTKMQGHQSLPWEISPSRVVWEEQGKWVQNEKTEQLLIKGSYSRTYLCVCQCHRLFSRRWFHSLRVRKTSL